METILRNTGCTNKNEADKLYKCNLCDEKFCMKCRIGIEKEACGFINEDGEYICPNCQYKRDFNDYGYDEWD